MGIRGNLRAEGQQLSPSLTQVAGWFPAADGPLQILASIQSSPPLLFYPLVLFPFRGPDPFEYSQETSFWATERAWSLLLKKKMGGTATKAWKFQDQGSNPHQSCNPISCGDKARSLTHRRTPPHWKVIFLIERTLASLFPVVSSSSWKEKELPNSVNKLASSSVLPCSKPALSKGD